jgi:hypothetical protein
MSALLFGAPAMAQSDSERLGDAMAAAPAGAAAQRLAVQNRLQVRRYVTTAMSNARADQITANATAVLRRNDGPGDVACATSFVRSGNVTSFSNGDGSIDSSAEFNAITALAGWVKVVNQINWCGALVPNVIGCAPVPGRSLVVVRFTGNQEGILWAHEFGHNAGLNHRSDANAVMNGTIGTTRRRVNATECAAFRAIPAGAVLARLSNPQPAAAQPAMDVRSFVRQAFVEGVPYEDAARFGAAAVPTLLAMLRDKREEQHWPNIVVVLGMIGEEAVVDPLIKFIEAASPARLPRAHYTAKTSAVMALGYLVNKSGNARALDYLKQSAKPEAWSSRLRRGGIAEYQASTAERDMDFSKYAILGLALSGRPEAAQTLRSLQRPAQTAGERAIQSQLGDLLAEALKEHDKISKQGLQAYYRNKGL